MNTALQIGRSAPATAPGTLRAVMLVLVLALLAIGNTVVAPQADAQQELPLYRQTPYDLITLKSGKQAKILPLELANRRVVLQSRGRLSVRLVKEPDEERVIDWSAIADIDLFEELVLKDAIAKTDEKKFDEAFDHFAFLLRNYPKVEGLDSGVQDYLYQNAIDLFTRQGNAAKALSTLEELYERNPEYQFRSGATVISAISGVTNKLLSDYNAQQDLGSMRSMLRRLIRTYGDNRLASVGTWKDTLAVRAAKKRDELKAHLDAGRLREAHAASREMMAIWPDVEGGRELAVEASRRYPIVKVAVDALAQDPDPTAVSNWPARRTGRLLYRTLLEFLGPGADGGQYTSPYGTVTRRDDLRQFTLKLKDSGANSQVAALTGYDVARRLRDLADPDSPTYLPSWAALVDQINVREVYNVLVDLRRPNVLPEALLQIPVEPLVTSDGEEPADALSGQGPYVVEESTDENMRFVQNPDYSMSGESQPAEIVEAVYDDPRLALNDLRAGRIDIIDRLFPADTARLLTGAPDRNVVLREYEIPTIHLLVPNLDNPFLARATFRRALVYAIPRQIILDQLLLEENPLQGCHVISGPFTSGKSLNDPLSYAYDTNIQPRPYDPRLAMLLRFLAQEELKQLAEQKMEPVPQLQPLLIGHPARSIPRMVCKAIQMNLAKLGIECSLKEFPPGQVTDESGDCDLVYMEVLMAEPVVDARRLLSAEGLARSPSAYISLGLRRLDQASQWRDVSSQLHALHRLVHEDVTIIPLFQVLNYSATHSGIEGVGSPTFSLYQNVENWRAQPQLDEEL